MLRITRKADWFLVIALVIFLGGTFLNFSIWLFEERPLVAQMQKDSQGATNPGAHNFPATVSLFFRTAVSVASLGVGFVVALAGSFGIPRKLKSSRTLREACWGGFVIGFFAMVMLWLI